MGLRVGGQARLSAVGPGLSRPWGSDRAEWTPEQAETTSRLLVGGSAAVVPDTAYLIPLIGVGAMFGFLWLGQIATVAMTGVLPPDLIKAGISSNPVYALDLALSATRPARTATRRAHLDG